MTPRNFEAYWASLNLPKTGHYLPVYDAARRAWDAAIASHETRLENLVSATRDWHAWHRDDAGWQTDEPCRLCVALDALDGA